MLVKRSLCKRCGEKQAIRKGTLCAVCRRITDEGEAAGARPAAEEEPLEPTETDRRLCELTEKLLRAGEPPW